MQSFRQISYELMHLTCLSPVLLYCLKFTKICLLLGYVPESTEKLDISPTDGGLARVVDCTKRFIDFQT